VTTDLTLMLIFRLYASLVMQRKPPLREKNGEYCDSSPLRLRNLTLSRRR